MASSNSRRRFRPHHNPHKAAKNDDPTQTLAALDPPAPCAHRGRIYRVEEHAVGGGDPRGRGNGGWLVRLPARRMSCRG